MLQKIGAFFKWIYNAIYYLSTVDWAQLVFFGILVIFVVFGFNWLFNIF